MAQAQWMTLEELIKTTDLSHYKSESNTWSWNNLISQYYGTDWNLAIIPMSGSRLLRKSGNNQYYFTQVSSGGGDSYYSFPTKRKFRITKINADIKITNQAMSEYNRGRIAFMSVNSNMTSTWTNGLVVVYNSSKGDCDYNVTDQNYHTYDKDIVVENIDYIVLTGVGNAGVYFENVKFLVEEVETSNGGGATHIAKVTGQLKDLSSNLSDILMVSGGGGGGYLVGENAYAGADAGGISGSGSNSGNQSTGYAFGQGESGTNKSGGGGGLYGGYKSTV